jgi:predicted alpha/beta hydrolase
MEAPTTFELVAADGYKLGATLFEPLAPASGTLILHGATAVPQRFYREFALYLAGRGVRVLTYDYRGVGLSRPRSLRGHPGTMTEWARLDARAAHACVGAHYGRQPVAILGHSFGGQLIGLVDEPQDTSGAVLVGAQFGYFGHWSPLQRARLALIWYAAVPALTAAFGYLPGQIGLGADLPQGVAREWGAWCVSPEYLVSKHPDAAERLARFDRPTLNYSFTDDELAPKRAVQALLSRLPSARLDHRRLRPQDLGGTPIGHFGFFRRTFRDSLWADTLAFLRDVFHGRPPSRAKAARPAWDVRAEDIVADMARCGG